MTYDWAQIDVKAWESNGFLLETYYYSIGQVEPLPSHVHSEYQFALSLGTSANTFITAEN